MDIFRTIIVKATDATLARGLAAVVPGGSGMFTTGLSKTGKAPATHYISSGLLPAPFILPLPLKAYEEKDGAWVLVSEEPGDAAAVVKAAADNGVTVTLAAVKGLFTRSDCTTQEPFTAMGRLTLKLVSEVQ